MIDIRMTGRNSLAKVAAQCKEAAAAGDGSVRREVGKALKKATEPAKDAVREAARSQLPSGGGLNDLIAGARITTQANLRGASPSVRLRGKWSGHDIRAIDRGRLRHPVFGHDVWTTQSVEPGFWTKTLKREGLKTRRDVILAMEKVSRMVAR